MMASLGALLRWSLFIVLIAIGAHVATLYCLPGLLMARALAQSAEGVGVNVMAFPPRSGPTTDSITPPNPDELVATCVFDLTQSRLRLSADMPADGTWSMTIYGEDSRAFYFKSNRDGAAAVNAVLVEPGGIAHADPGTDVIDAPTFTGIVLIRSLINDEANLAQIDRVRHQASCQAISR